VLLKPPAVAHLQRSRYLPQDGGGTVFLKLKVGRLGKFFSPDQVPDFEGEEAWFEIEKDRGRYRFIRQVEPSAGEN
jgi:hypothetical protein